MSAKDDLLEAAAEEFARLRAAYAGLTAEQLTRAMLGSWSIREILCHVAGWHREMIPVLDRIALGERPVPEGVSYDEPDPWNQRFVSAYADKSVHEVVAEVEASHQALMAAARKVPEGRFAPGRSAARTVEGVGPHHYREHAEQIRRWRKAEGL